MSTKRPSIVILSEIIQKYVGTDYDKLLAALQNVDSSGAASASNILNTPVNYTAEGYPQETLGALLKQLTIDVMQNEDGLDVVGELNEAVSSNTSSISALLEEVDFFISNVLSGKTYQGEYDATNNVPNLITPVLDFVKKGYVYDVTVAGNVFFGQALNIGDSIRSKVDNPIALSDWVILPLVINPAAIKVQYESNADTNAFTDAEQTKLAGIEAGAEVNDDTLQNVYDRGGVVAVSDANGSVVLDGSVENTPGLRIVPTVVMPSVNLASGALATDADGTLYSYDGIRNKWLSVAEIPYHFSRDGNADGIYLDFQSIIDSNTGYVIPRNGTIVGIRARGSNSPTKEFTLELNGANSFEFALAGGQYDDQGIDIDVTDTDVMRMYAKSGGAAVRNALVSLYIKWRK